MFARRRARRGRERLRAQGGSRGRARRRRARGGRPGGRISIPASGPPATERGQPSSAVGTTFAGHRIDGVAGRGGMGVVYRATDLTLDRRVALKLIASERRGRRGVPRALRARVPGRRFARAPARRADLPRRARGRPAVRDDALRRGDGPARAARRGGRGSTRSAPSRRRARSPARSTRRTGTASSTATSSPATSCSGATATASASILTDFGVTKQRTAAPS